MNIGFYGDSRCQNAASAQSWMRLLADHFDADIAATGTVQCSEERILYQLKKTRDLDLAVIFHSESHLCLFLPNMERDLHQILSDQRAEYLLENQHFFNVEMNIPENRSSHPRFHKQFRSGHNLIKILNNYRKIFYDNDASRNRYWGSLIQIDQYLTAKKIPAIHVPTPGQTPDWFRFSSGRVADDVRDIFKQHYQHKSVQPFLNWMTPEGNLAVFQRLKEIVEELIPPSPAGVA